MAKELSINDKVQLALVWGICIALPTETKSMLCEAYMVPTAGLQQIKGLFGKSSSDSVVLSSYSCSFAQLPRLVTQLAISFFALMFLCMPTGTMGQVVTGTPDPSPNIQLLNTASDGDVPAQVQVGKIYYKGINRRRNFKQAARWFEAASSAGSVEAQAWLGQMYVTGTGLDRDTIRGAQLIQGAAAKGDPVGLRFSGLMHETGQGAPRDPAQAAVLYQQAADKNDASACDHLGSLYVRGFGVARNMQKAFDLFSRGAKLGDSWAQLHLGEMYQHGRVPANKMQPLSPSLQSAPLEERRAAMKRQNLEDALKLFSAAASQGNRVAAFKAGQMYERGAGTDRDYEKAFSFYEQSASHRYALAQLALGRAHELGRGTSVNLLHAYVAYSLAAEQGNPLAARRLESLVSRLSPEQLSTAQKKLKQLKELEASLSAQ